MGTVEGYTDQALRKREFVFAYRAWRKDDGYEGGRSIFPQDNFTTGY